MNFIFFCNILYEKDIFINNNLSFAANNYQYKFISIYQPSYIISLLPIFITKEKFNRTWSNSIQYVHLRSNNIALRLVYGVIKSLIYIWKSNKKRIVFYNLDKQNLLIIFFSKFILRKKVFILVADYTEYNNLYGKILKKLYKMVDGTIVFNSNFRINKYILVSPGLILEKDIRLNNQKKIAKNIILSGSLGKTTGLEIALEGFCKRPDLQLFVTGKSFRYTEYEFKNIINKYNIFKNIHYLGALPKEEYLNMLGKCDIALSLRNPYDIEHSYNFPSKILEYLANGKIVVSTLMYTELPDGFLFISKFEPENLINTVDNILNMDQNQIYSYYHKIYSYLINESSQEKLVNRLTDFIF